MADLTSGLNRKKAAAVGLSAEVANSVQTYGGMWAGMRGPDHATTQGYLDAYDDEKGMVFAGGDLDFDILGDTTASPPTANALGIDPAIYKGATVTGVASRADIMKPVYATDSNTLTLTAPTYGTPIGIVTNWATGTTCDVMSLGLPAQAALDLSGQGADVIHLGSFSFKDTSDGDLLTSYPMPYHGSIESFWISVGEGFVGSSGACTLNLELGTTNVTGGVVTVATATCGTVGTVLTATAITAENVFHAGDLLSVEGSSSATTRTSGTFNLYIKIRPRMGV